MSILRDAIEENKKKIQGATALPAQMAGREQQSTGRTSVLRQAIEDVRNGTEIKTVTGTQPVYFGSIWKQFSQSAPLETLQPKAQEPHIWTAEELAALSPANRSGSILQDDAVRSTLEQEGLDTSSGKLPLYTNEDLAAAQAIHDRFTPVVEQYQGRRLDGAERGAVENAMKELTDLYNRSREDSAQRQAAGNLLAQMRDLDRLSSYPAYTMAQLGTGMASTIQNIEGGARTLLGDLSSGMEYSAGYQTLEQFFRNNPGAYEGAAMAGGRGSIARIASQTGVDQKVVQAYMDATRPEWEAELVASTTGQGLNQAYQDTVGAWAYTIGQQLPGMIYTAGAPAAETGGILGTALSGGKVSGAVRAALRGNAATGMIGASAAGAKLNQLAREHGGNPLNYVNAAGTGFIEAFTEGLFGFSDMASFQRMFSGTTGSLSQSLGRALFRYVVSGVEEGLEETVNVPLEGLLDKATIDGSKPWVGDGGVFDVNAMVENGVNGAVVGLIMGGVGGVANVSNVIRESGDIRKAARALNQTARLIAEDLRPPDLDARTATMEDVEDHSKQVIIGLELTQERARGAAAATAQARQADGEGRSIDGGEFGGYDGSAAGAPEQGRAQDGAREADIQTAPQLQQKKEAGETVTARELGALHQENVGGVRQEQETEDPEGTQGQNILNRVLDTKEAPLDPTEQRAADTPQQQGELRGLNLPELEETAQASPVNMEPVTAERTDQIYGQQTQQSTGAGDLAGIAPSQGGAAAAESGGQQAPVPAAVSLPGRDGGRRRDVPGRGRVERVPEAARQRGGTRGNRELGESRRRMAADQPVVSPSDMGVAHGSEEQTLQVLPRESWDAEIAQGVAWAESKGVRDVTVVVGPIRVEVDGYTGAVQGFADKTERRIVIRADSITRSFSENLEHEVGHLLSTQDAVRTFAQLVKSRYKEDAWRPAYEIYQRKWAQVTNYYEGMTPEEIELYVFEEMMGDAYSETNRYGTRMSVYAAEADAALEGAAPEAPEAGTEPEGAGRETEAATGRTTGPPAGQERFSYGGRYANQADSESLAEAERLEMQGVDPETIRQETGWFRGADELWRFEIDDSSMEYSKWGDMQRSDRAEYARFRELEKKFIEGTLTEEEQAELRELIDRGHGHSRADEQGTQRLSDFIRHEELFRNYPQLKNMPLRFESLENGLMGVYDGNEVVLSDTLRDAPEETLIHEVQHAIQRAEGFASGANPRYWERQLQSGYDGRTAEKRREAAELWEQYYSIRDNEPEFFQAMVDLDAMAPDVPRGEINWDTLEQMQEDPPEWQRYDAAREAAEEKYGDTKVWDFIDLRYRLKQAELTNDRGAYDLYQDTAGEIEARDAAARWSMTAEQRRRIRPNTGNEDTVFAEIGAWMGDLDQEYGPQMQEEPTTEVAASQDGIQRVASMEPVASITGEEFRKGETDLISQVEDFFNEQGNHAYSPQLGEVILDRRGVKSDIGHGIGRKKAAAFAAVPEIIAQGQVVDYQENWKGRGYDTVVIAAPIRIGGDPYLAGVVVVRSRLTNRFYLHEVLAENDGAMPFKTGAQSNLGKPGGDTPSVISILGKIRDVKLGTRQAGQGARTAGTKYSMEEDNQGQEVDSYGLERYDGSSQTPLTADEEAAVLDYKSGGSYQLNAAIRDGYPLDQMQYRTVEALDAALEKLPRYPGTVYRRLGFDSIGGQEALDDFLAEHQQGELIQYPAYTSTSTDPEGYPVEGEQTVSMVIEGQSGRDLEGFGNNFEREILFPRKSRFVIERVDRDAQEKPVIYMREVTAYGAGQLHSQERSETVQQVQEAKPRQAIYLRDVSELDTGRNADGRLPGLRAGRAKQEAPTGRGIREDTEDGTGQLYPQERYGGVQPVPEVQQGDDHLREVPGMDSASKTGGALRGLRSGRAEGQGTGGLEAGSQENDGRNGRTQQQAGAGEGLNGSDVRFSVEDEADGRNERQNNEEGRRPRRQRTTRPVAESRPIIAKKDLRQNLLGLFSIPEGQRAELGAVIDQYADRLLKAGALTEQDRTALFDKMYASGVVTVPADDYFQTGREAVRGGKVYVAPKDQHEFGDDWNSFRKRAFAAGIYMTNNPLDQGIDQWNAELADMLPGLFDADELDNRAILERIVQVAEEGKDEKVSLAEYTAQLAEEEYVGEDQVLDDMERKMDWALRTFAEKANLEIRLRDRTGVKIAQEREHFAEQSKKQREREAIRRAEERDRRKAQLQRQRENKELRELQQKTLKQLQWLSKNRFRAPAELKAAWDEVLGDIDIYAAGAANEMNWSKRYGATWQDLAQMYKEAQKNDPNFLPSKELERIVMRLDGEKIADMDLSALQDLYRAAVGIRTEFYNRNNVINDELGRLFAEVYADAKQEIETAPGGYTGGAADRLFNLEQLTPMNVLERMGGWNPDSAFYSMAKQLEKGERDVRAYTVEANRYLEDFLTEHADWVKRADGQGKDAIWYELEVPELLELGMGDKPIFGASKKVYMTPSQKVHLYMESKNTDNLRHMTGGRTFVNRELYSQGKRQEALAQGTTIRMAPETVKKIVSDLTAEELELARLLENYYNDFATKRINAVSNALYGYDKAMGRNYAPIYTNKNYTKSEIGIFDVTAEGVGNLKARQYAVNPSYNIGAFDAFERHVGQTARFVGMSIPARNWQTLLNWREKNNSTGDVITHKWGEEGKRYITDLIERLQGGGSIERDTVSTAADRLLSQYISAIFGANPSIVTKQFGSIFMAMPELGIRNIPTPAQLRNIDKELIARYTSELAWRGMGYATPETKQLKENPNWTQTNKFTRFTFGGGAIIAADQTAASVLWPWAENKVRRELPDLEVGTREQIEAGQSPFYQKVAEEFNNAVSRSQSVSDEVHQGKLRKSRNPITRALTMFKSDSAQGYNQLRQRIGEAKYYERSGADAETVRKAKRAVGAAAMGILTNNLWATAITFLIALWKNKGKHYRDDEEELTVESVGIEMASTLFSSLAGLVAGGEELADVIGNIITGDTWYGIDAPGMEQVADLIELVDQQGKNGAKLLRGAIDVLNNDGNLGEYLQVNGGDIVGGVKELAQAVATYFGGIPVNNVEAYLLGLVKWVSPEVAAAYESAFSSAQKSDLTGLTGKALAVKTGSLLDLRVGETEEGTAEALAALYEQGYKKALPSDVPSSVSVNGTDYELSPYQQQVYRDVWKGVVAGTLDELVASDLFQEADAETKQSMLERLYEYGASQAKATLFADYETEGWVEGAGEAQQAGISAAEWAAYYTLVSEIKNDHSMTSYQRGEAGRDLIRAADLSDQQKLALYGAVYGSDADSRVEKFRAIMDAGLTFARTMDVYGKYAELEADEEAKAADQATDFHIWLGGQEFTAEQMGVIEEELSFWGSMKGQVNNKVVMANDYGIEPEIYYALKAAIAEIDTNGSTSQDEATAAINTLPGLTTRERAILWQLQNKIWKAYDNPFDVVAGQEVYQALNSDSGEEGVALPRLNLQEEPDLPSLSLPSIY